MARLRKGIPSYATAGDGTSRGEFATKGSPRVTLRGMRLTVSPATPGEQAAACRVLFGHHAGPDRDQRAARCRDLLASGELDPAGLFVARDGHGAVRGAALVQPLPGALGLAWPPRAEAGRERA